MDFDLSEEQRLLKESVERVVADRYTFKLRGDYAKSEKGYSEQMWAQYAELGILGLPFAEADGGFGGGPVETMIVMEALGRKLALEPYMATVVLSGGLIRHAGSDAQRADLVAQIAEGSLTLAFAHGERQSRYDLADVATTAKADGDGYVITGEKGLVLNGDSADKLIVSARVSGGTRDQDGIGLFIVDGNAPGVSRRGYATQDGQRAAEISLNGVKVGKDAVLGTPGKAYPVIARVIDEAIAALCSEGVGAMSALQELTVEYLKTRKQFGTHIGNFQVLQHRAVEMLIEVEQARSMTMLATMMSAEDDARERETNIAAAKVQLGKSARFVGQEGTQLHGGIGMTMEYEGGHYFKRLTMIAAQFGDVDFHLRRLARAGGLIRAA